MIKVRLSLPLDVVDVKGLFGLCKQLSQFLEIERLFQRNIGTLITLFLPSFLCIFSWPLSETREEFRRDLWSGIIGLLCDDFDQEIKFLGTEVGVVGVLQ